MSGGGTAGGRIAPGVGANLIGQHAQDRNQDATVYVGNLDVQMTEELVWELCTQAGPVVNVYLPKDRVTNQHQGYGFVEFRSEEDADYSIKILNMIKIYGKPIRVNKSSQDKRSQDIGANLFIGNLDPDVDEKLLYDTFSAFGMIVSTPKIMRDPDTGLSKGFGFVSYETFEASDAAIEAMHNQFLMNRPITVGYAFKKDAKGERHGTPAERLLAEQQRKKAAAQSRPNTLFATGACLRLVQRQFEEVGLAGPRQGQQGGAVLGAGADGGVPPPPPAMGGAQGAPWGQSQPAYGLQRPPPVPAQYQQQPLPAAEEADYGVNEYSKQGQGAPPPWAQGSAPPLAGQHWAPPPWAQGPPRGLPAQRPPPQTWMAQPGAPPPPFAMQHGGVPQRGPPPPAY